MIQTKPYADLRIHRKGADILKKLYTLLDLLAATAAGVYLGGSVWRWYDYTKHPQFYVSQSAPWYLSIEVNGLILLLFLLLLWLIRWFIRRRQSKSAS